MKHLEKDIIGKLFTYTAVPFEAFIDSGLDMSSEKKFVAVDGAILMFEPTDKEFITDFVREKLEALGEEAFRRYLRRMLYSIVDDIEDENDSEDESEDDCSCCCSDECVCDECRTYLEREED